MSLKHLIVTTPLVLLLTQGCSNNSSIFSKDHLPLVHKVDVQQGNVITQEMLAKLQLGMTKKKVRFIMGTPLISDTFHSERWDYVYTYKDGRELREQRRVTMFFKDDLLAKVGGDVVGARGEIKLKQRKVESIEVPAAKPAGIFSQVKEKLSFDKDKPKNVSKKAVQQPEMVGEGAEKESFLGRLFDGDADVVSSEDSEFGPNDPYLHEADQQIEFEDVEPSETATRKQNRVDPDLDPNNPYLHEQDQQIEFPEEVEKTDDEVFVESSESNSSESNSNDDEVDEEPGFFGKLWDKVSGDDEGDVETDIDPDADPNDPYLYEK